MAKSSSSSSSSDSDSEKKVAKPVAAAKPAPAKKAASSSSSSSDSDGAAAKKKAPAAAPVAAATKAKILAADAKAKADSSSSSSDDEKPAAKAAAKPAAAAPAKKKAASSSSSSSDDDKKPAAKAAAAPAKKAASSSSSSDDEKPAAKAAPAKKAASSSSSSSDDDKPAPAAKRTAEQDVTEEAPLKKAKASNGAAIPTATATPNGDAAAPAGEVKTVFVGGLSFDSSEADVTEFFKDCGTVVSCRIPLRDDGKSKGMAFVEFETAEAANKAVAKNEQELQGRWLRITLSTQAPKERKVGLSEKPAGCKTLFLGNLSFNVTEDDLRAFFGECGTVTRVRIATHADTGNPRGFGHVEFEEEDAVDKAVKLAGQDVAGRAIRIDYAGGKEGGSATGGRGGRGGFGDRGGRGGFGGRGRGGFGDRGGRGGRGGFRGGRGGAMSEAKARTSGAINTNAPSKAKKIDFD